MKSVIILSVGTSCINNNLGIIAAARTLRTKFDEYDFNVGEMQGLELNFNDNTLKRFEVSGSSEPFTFANLFFKEYLNEDTIKRNLRRRQPYEKGSDRLPAEISSLYLHYYPTIDGDIDQHNCGTDDRIILLTTDTADSIYCAKLLQTFLKNLDCFRSRIDQNEVSIETIESVDFRNPDKWAGNMPGTSNGLNNLIAYFEANVSNFEQFRRIIIRTGAYKEFSSFLLLCAMQFGFQSKYLFEDSIRFVITNIEAWPDNIWRILPNTLPT